MGLRCGRDLARYVAAVAEADEVVRTAYHYVIEQIDAKELRGVDEVLCDGDVLRARSGVLTRVVVQNYDVRDGLDDGGAEDLGGPYDRRV